MFGFYLVFDSNLDKRKKMLWFHWIRRQNVFNLKLYFSLKEINRLAIKDHDNAKERDESFQYFNEKKNIQSKGDELFRLLECLGWKMKVENMFINIK